MFFVRPKFQYIVINAIALMLMFLFFYLSKEQKSKMDSKNTLVKSDTIIIEKVINSENINKIMEVTSLENNKGCTYTFINISGFNYSFETTRPSSSLKENILCIPAAFTDLNNGKIDGVYVSQASKNKINKVNPYLKGLLFATNENIINIDQKEKIKNLDSLIDKTENCLFQQILLVNNGVSLYRDNKNLDKFQRRCVAKFKEGDYIIETNCAITMKEFSNDLVDFGVTMAIYTDMGSYDEGWYKSGPNIVKIGLNKSNTKKQSNWFLVKQY
jgi:hypothetical protein